MSFHNLQKPFCIYLHHFFTLSIHQTHPIPPSPPLSLQFSHSFPSIFWQHLTPHMTLPPFPREHLPSLHPPFSISIFPSYSTDGLPCGRLAALLIIIPAIPRARQASGREWRLATRWHHVVSSTTSGEHWVHSTLCVLLSFPI